MGRHAVLTDPSDQRRALLPTGPALGLVFSSVRHELFAPSPAQSQCGTRPQAGVEMRVPCSHVGLGLASSSVIYKLVMTAKGLTSYMFASAKYTLS